MATTFGDDLKLFAQSVDVIGTERLERVGEMIKQYCRKTLEIDRVKLMIAGNVDGKDVLRRHSLSSTVESEADIPVKAEGGRPSNQTALAFLRNRPLWIVSSKGKRKLVDCDRRYKDQWSGVRAIPPFGVIGGDPVQSEIKTSIIIPLGQDDYRSMGVLNFETHEYLDITDAAKSELLKLADSAAILLQHRDSRKLQRECTGDALATLERSVSRTQPKLTKPKVFFAFSANAESDVVGTVDEVLATIRDQFELMPWDEMHRPGNISEDLLEMIAKCRFGLCYMSEPDGDGGYRDNPNVLFEAGMFHGRTDGIIAVPRSWIPIREEQSPQIPFDFAQQRMVKAQRTKEGRLKVREFKRDLSDKLKGLLDTEKMD